MNGVTTIPEYGYIDSTPLAVGASGSRFAWMATDLAEVRLPAATRGSDVLIPGVSGIITNPRRVTATTRLIPMLFTGDCDLDGDPGGVADEQVWVNLDWFRALVVQPSSGDPRRELTVVHGSLTWVGDVVVERFDYRARGPAEIVGVLEVTLPDGHLMLEPTSS